MPIRTIVRRIIAVVAGLALCGILAEGMVYAGRNLATDPPAWTYRWFFQRALFAIDAVWAHAHGWRSETACMVAKQEAREARARMPLVDEAFTFVDSATGKRYKMHGKEPQRADAADDRKRWDAVKAVCDNTHMWEFSSFYKHSIEFLGPLFGFALFRIISPPGKRARSLPDAKRREDAVQDVVGGGGSGDGVDGA
jgi:hypothetical protein